MPQVTQLFSDQDPWLSELVLPYPHFSPRSPQAVTWTLILLAEEEAAPGVAPSIVRAESLSTRDSLERMAIRMRLGRWKTVGDFLHLNI